MGTYEENLEANRKYAERFHLGEVPAPPAKKLAVVACMDARLTVEEVLGLKSGDAHIIRNAGGLVTEDALRSLIISSHLLGTRTFYVIQHTDCGMLSFTDAQLRERLEKQTGQDASHLHFHAFPALEESVRAQLAKIRENPFLAHVTDVHGFIFDVRTGKLREVERVEGIDRGRVAGVF
jgi:carbonic anhydrase